ncbi:MAG: SMC-Scp complex subunit ScpB [bacterium]|nr:SMC-Scp complex subunit ScpB [bacterium]
MNDHKRAIEALIFASDFPLSEKKIAEIIGGIDEKDAAEIIAELQKEFQELDRGFLLDRSAGGYEFVTRKEYSGIINRLMAGRRKNRLSRAGLETMALIAYNQPITRVDIEKVRGVDSGGPLRTLLERKLISIAGREKAPGRPLIYKTTDDFLRYLGLDSVSDLPKTEEIEDILRDDKIRENLEIEQLSVESGDSGEEEVRPDN